MTEVTVSAACGTTKTFDSRSDAEDGADTHAALCEECGDDDVVITSGGDEAAHATDDGAVVQQGGQTDGGPEVVEEAVGSTSPPENDDPAPEPVASDLPNDPSIKDDPVDWLPSHFIDQIQGVPTVNRKGYAVIASKYNVSVTAEPVTLASSTDFEYAEFQATAVTESGEEYSGFGSAHVDRMDGDDQYLLNELAETRSLKRAVSWATGVGLTAAAEMQGDLE